jgi:putative inorganic carbon (HCO3(-)) transporter
MRRSVEFLLSIEFWLVAALAILGLLLPAWLPAVLIGIALFWPLRRLVGGRWSQRTPVDWSVVLLVCLALATLWVTALPGKTLPQVLRLLVGAALFYALVNWGSSASASAASGRKTSAASRLRSVSRLAAGLGLVLALASPLVVNWTATKLPFLSARIYEHFPTLVQDTVNPNVMAGSLALLLPISLAACLFAWKECSRQERLLYTAAVACGGVVLLLTQSRGAWVAIVLSLAVLLALRWRWGWLIGLGMAAAGLLLAVLVGFDEAASALMMSASLGSLAGRLEVWSRAIFLIQDFPFTGIGMGSFTETADRLYPFFLYLPASIEHAHNLFLQIAVDLGLLGIISWLAIWMGLAFAAWQVWRAGRRSADSWLTGLGAGLLCSQVVLVVHGLTDAVVWGIARPAILVWLVWGMIASALALVEGRRNVGLPAV